MKLTVLVIALISVAWALPQVEDEPDFLYPTVDPIINVTGQVTPRIVNGVVAAPHSIPYQVYLHVFAYAKSWLCSGTLISENYVLTAAHCINEAVKAEVYLGFYDLGKMDSGQKLLIATSFTAHENYTNTNGVIYDIGVIQLPQTIVLNDFIDVVPLPTRAEVLQNYEGENGRVSGWGRTVGSSEKNSNLLIQANSTVISNDLCGRYFKTVQEYNVCISGEEGVASCKGDSGGPLVIGEKQVGLVSFGVTQCLDGYPSAFTRISSFFDWLEAHTDLKF